MLLLDFFQSFIDDVMIQVSGITRSLSSKIQSSIYSCGLVEVGCNDVAEAFEFWNILYFFAI